MRPYSRKIKTRNNIGSVKIKHLIWFLCGLTLSSCVMRPREVLSNRKMVSLLADLHYAEGVLQAAGYQYGHDQEVNDYYAALLEKHGVTQAQFDSSLVWYTVHPQYFQRVYPKVLERVEQRYADETARLSALDAELKAALADSLAAAENKLPRRTYEEEMQLARHGLSSELYQPLPVLPLFTDSIWAAIESLKEQENDSVVLKTQEKLLNDEKKSEKTCENEEKAVILQSISEKGHIVPRRKI